MVVLSGTYRLSEKSLMKCLSHGGAIVCYVRGPAELSCRARGLEFVRLNMSLFVVGCGTAGYWKKCG